MGMSSGRLALHFTTRQKVQMAEMGQRIASNAQALNGTQAFAAAQA